MSLPSLFHLPSRLLVSLSSLLLSGVSCVAWIPYEQAGIQMEVSRRGGERGSPNGPLCFSLRENQSLVFSQVLDGFGGMAETLSLGTHELSYGDNGIATFLYRRSGLPTFTLTLAADGKMGLPGYQDRLGFEDKLSWGFKTFGTLEHTGTSLFHSFSLNANRFHNQGILKSQEACLVQNHRLNEGIIHFGSENGWVDEGEYGEALSQVVLQSLAQQREGRTPPPPPAADPGQKIVEEKGIFIAEGGWIGTDLSYNIHGVMKVEGAGLTLQNSSLHNHAQVQLQGPLQGQAPRVVNHGEWHMPSFSSFTVTPLTPPSFTVTHFENTGEMIFSEPTRIAPVDTFNNTGMLIGLNSLKVYPGKTPVSLGVVLSADELEMIVAESVQEAARKAFMSTGGLSGKKVRREILKHTDHYLNTITPYEEVDQWGRVLHRYQTETGNVFQRRTTEKKVIEENEPIDPKIAKVIQDARADMQMQKDAAERVREKVRRRGGSAASEARALRALAQAFRDQGMDISALSDLLGSPFFEAFSTLVSAFDSQSRNPAGEEGVKAYLNIPQIMNIGVKRGISPNDFQSTFTASLKLVQDFATRASATAQPLWEWVGRNKETIVENIVDVGISLIPGGKVGSLFGKGVLKGAAKGGALFGLKTTLKPQGPTPLPPAHPTTPTHPATSVQPQQSVTRGEAIGNTQIPTQKVDPYNASNPNAQDALNRKFRALEKASSKPETVRTLDNDTRTRYYQPEKPATTPGPTRGATQVTEYNSKTGQVRSWHESRDHQGNVNRVHPKMIDGQTVQSQHYPMTKTEKDSLLKVKKDQK